MRPIFALLVVCFAAAGAARAASEAHQALVASIPEGNALTFRAYLGDTDLGVHKMRWSVSGQTVVVNIEIDLGARVLFLPVYSYKHRSKETWTDGVLTAISTTTDDDGKTFTVTGELKGNAFDVKGTEFTGAIPLPMAPTSYWDYGTLKKGTWMSTQSGQVLKVRVSPKGPETIKTRTGQIQANRYDASGDLEASLWYDARKRWVKSRFVVGGNTITYVLQ